MPLVRPPRHPPEHQVREQKQPDGAPDADRPGDYTASMPTHNRMHLPNADVESRALPA